MASNGLLLLWVIRLLIRFDRLSGFKFWMRDIMLNARMLYPLFLHVCCTCVEVVQYTPCHRLYASPAIWHKSRILGSTTCGKCTNVLLILVHKAPEFRWGQVELSVWVMHLLWFYLTLNHWMRANTIVTHTTCIQKDPIMGVIIATFPHGYWWYHFVRLEDKSLG